MSINCVTSKLSGSERQSPILSIIITRGALGFQVITISNCTNQINDDLHMLWMLRASKEQLAMHGTNANSLRLCYVQANDILQLI